MRAPTVPLPARMQGLPRDRRGFPIPKIVMVDQSGHAHFAVNDEGARFIHLADDLCPICGQKLLRARWFAGGPRSAFHDGGAYFDTPMHDECVHYAMRVCPYLALRHYSGGVADAAKRHLPAMKLKVVDLARAAQTQVYPARPSLFVLVQALGQEFRPQGVVVPKRPYRRIEFWRHGVEISREEGLALCAELKLAPAPDDRFGPRRIDRSAP